MKQKEKVIGIVAEYNPFHRGHEYLISEAKRLTGAEVCVSVMSGNFVQRGEPAVFNKWTRAENAVRNGVDLVVELPVVYAVSGAEYFARGAISVLEGLGGVTHLAFGSESGDAEALERCSQLLRNRDEEISQLIKENTKRGMSYPAAREKAVLEIAPDTDSGILSEPNNILALEYLSKVNSMIPFTVKREGVGYHESASQIRKEMLQESEAFRKELEKSGEVFFDLLRAKILSESPKELENTASAGEGLGNRMKKLVRMCESVDDFCRQMKTKRYTMTRIRRLMLQTVLDITREDIEDAVPYIRVLAFNQKGGEFLKRAKKQELISIPVVDNINRDTEGKHALGKTVEKDILAGDIYNLITGKDLYSNSDYVKKPVFVK